MVAVRKVVRVLLVGVLIFGATFLLTRSVNALDKQRLNKWSNYQVYFYDPDAQNCIKRPKPTDPDNPYVPVTPLVGSTRIEKIWNYIAGLGISGLSDRPEAIAGIVGNMATETGNSFNPFIQNSGGCTGLIQWCKGSWNEDFFSYMRNKGYEKYYYKGSEPSIDEEIINEGISAELAFLFGNYPHGVTATKYIATLNVPTNKSGTSGARAYSDLFLVTVENAFGGSDAIEDPGVASIASSSTYQAAASRRAHAEELFKIYGGKAVPDNPEVPVVPDNPDNPEEPDDTEYCEEDPDNPYSPDDPDNPDTPEAGNLASYVLSWAWHEYHPKPYTVRKDAYADYIDHQATYKGDCSGVDCGAFVSNIIVASGWDPSYPLGPTSTQSSWLASHWNRVDVGSLRLGDVGIKPGHVILYVGSLPGFGSNTASASQCGRAPMAGSPYENLGNYTWYRKR